jgi:CD109 antigen
MNFFHRRKKISFDKNLYLVSIQTKPPLAGPYAFSRIPKPRWENPRIYLKKFVKDSWFSEEIISTGYDGRTTLTRKVPYENPQNWKVSGFSVDPIYGLGVNNNLGTIQVNRNFHITTRIPHSMKVGELLSVPITAFNRFNTSLRVEISVKKSDDDFLIINEKDATGLVNSGALSEKKEILIPAASQVTTKFILKFMRAGDKKININAVSNIAVDEIEHNLHVNHEGFPRIMNKKFFIDLRNNQEFKTNVTLSVPNYNVIPQSIKLEASGRSNILGLISEKLEMSTK